MAILNYYPKFKFNYSLLIELNLMCLVCVQGCRFANFLVYHTAEHLTDSIILYNVICIVKEVRPPRSFVGKEHSLDYEVDSVCGQLVWFTAIQRKLAVKNQFIFQR